MRIIEVYVINKEVITQKSLEGRPVQGHYCTVREISKTEKIISEEDEKALQFVETLVTGKDFRIRIFDVASFKGKIRARLKGVKITPTIIVGDRRVVGVPKKEEFEALLRQ